MFPLGRLAPLLISDNDIVPSAPAIAPAITPFWIRLEAGHYHIYFLSLFIFSIFIPSLTMTNNLQATTAPTPQQELPALVTKVAALSNLALDLTRQCIDINLTAALAELTADIEFVEGVAITPDALDALFPPGVGKTTSPGTSSAHEANDQVLGVPHQFRCKKSGRAEALVFYRTKHVAGQVAKMTGVPPVPAGPSTSG
ncbi:hypothetical protein C8R44DRAFT_892342 [Mycena epipterygia]|nr:hypothetical protein C8R44DRAFT_892342 [Mycena epipterygia]